MSLVTFVILGDIEAVMGIQDLPFIHLSILISEAAITKYPFVFHNFGDFTVVVLCLLAYNFT